MHINIPFLPFFSSGLGQRVWWFSFCALKGSAQGTPPLDRNWSNKALTACGNLSTRIVLGISSWKLYTWCLSALLHSPPWFLMRLVLNWCIAATKTLPANAMSCEKRVRTLACCMTRWFKQAVWGGKLKSLRFSKEWVVIGVGTSLQILYLKTVWCTPASQHLCSCATRLPGKEIKWREGLAKIRVFRTANEKNEWYVMAGNVNELCSVFGRACWFSQYFCGVVHGCVFL